MRLTRLEANSDLVGRRVVLRWGFVLDANEGLSDVPAVTLRRKLHDFEFPPPAPGDPFLVYADGAFPPPGTTVSEVDLGTTLEGDTRVVEVAESSAIVADDSARELVRRTTRTTFDAADHPVAVEVAVLDAGPDGLGLVPGETCYYELTGAGIARTPDPTAARATAIPGDAYAHGRALYDLLPAVLRRHDTVTRQPDNGFGAIPEAGGRGGQLRRFVDLFGLGLDALRSSAEGLSDLHDVGEADARFLPLLARWIGWPLSVDKPIPEQRHEIRYAATLYRITGTTPGCMVWVRRLTGWDCEVKEFARNVFLTNDLGNPDDPSDHGSRTVDTSNATLLARIKTAEDELDYTYDTGTGPDDWYAFNVIGLFVTPGEHDGPLDILRKKTRLETNAPGFLPVNLRAVVIAQVPTAGDRREDALGLQRTTDEEPA